jgi:hypothetical protein
MAEWEALPNLRLRVEGNHIERTGAAHRFEWRAGFGWNL